MLAPSLLPLSQLLGSRVCGHTISSSRDGRACFTPVLASRLFYEAQRLLERRGGARLFIILSFQASSPPPFPPSPVMKCVCMSVCARLKRGLLCVGGKFCVFFSTWRKKVGITFQAALSPSLSLWRHHLSSIMCIFFLFFLSKRGLRGGGDLGKY